MKGTIITCLLLAAAGLSAVSAQQPAAQQKGPAPKSQKEAQALQAMFQAKQGGNHDATIKAADALIVGFADTDFKDLALEWAAEAYQAKGDAEKAVIYGERALEANKNNYQAMLLLAEVISQRTREFDFDKEEKLGRAEKYAKAAIEALKTAPKPNPTLPDEQWEAFRKQMSAQAHQSLWSVAITRKKYDVAITEIKAAIDLVSGQEPAFQVRLAQAYALAGKNDEAIAACNQVLAMPNIHPQVKSAAEGLRDSATKAKAAGAAKPATPAGPTQVEIKP